MVLPTDTVYGVAALPTLPGATARLFELKGRAGDQPLAVLVADAQQARDLVDPALLSDDVERWMGTLWPGSLTLVMPRSAAATVMELGHPASTIGVRCPDSSFVCDLAEVVGPIATTSANLHGEPTPITALAAGESLSGQVDLVVDGGPAGSVPSTVVEVGRDGWRVLRVGSITEADLRG